MQMHLALGVGGCLCALGEMFLHRGARSFGIAVEFEQTLGESAIVHALFSNDSGYHVAVATLFEELVESLAVEFLAGGFQFGDEGEFVEVGDELGYGSALLEFIGAAVNVFKQGLEHARCGS